MQQVKNANYMAHGETQVKNDMGNMNGETQVKNDKQMTVLHTHIEMGEVKWRGGSQYNGLCNFHTSCQPHWEVTPVKVKGTVADSMPLFAAVPWHVVGIPLK